MATYILGISALYHDSAACLVRDGVPVAAAEEERFSRKKGDERFPSEPSSTACRKPASRRPISTASPTTTSRS